MREAFCQPEESRQMKRVIETGVINKEQSWCCIDDIVRELDPPVPAINQGLQLKLMLQVHRPQQCPDFRGFSNQEQWFTFCKHPVNFPVEYPLFTGIRDRTIVLFCQLQLRRISVASHVHLSRLP